MSFWKSVKKAFKSVKSIALPAIGAVIGGPAGAAIGSGISSYTSNHNIGKALASSAGSYVGSNIGGALLGGTGGTVGNAVNTALGSDLGSAVNPQLGANIVGANLGSVVGSGVGSSIGSSLASGLVPDKNKNPTGEAAAPPFKPTQQAEATLPVSLASMSAFSPIQRATNVATQGVYGGGNGPDEQAYFLNLLNRRLVDPSGKVDSDLSEINPIENSYLAQLGLGGYTKAPDLLKAIQGWKAA